MTIKNLRFRTHHAIRASILQLCAFSLIFTSFLLGLLTIRQLIIFPLNGFWQTAVAFSTAMAALAVAAPLIVGAHIWLTALGEGENLPLHNAFKLYSDLESILWAQKICFSTLFCFLLSMLPTVLAACFLLINHTLADLLLALSALIFTLRLFCGFFPLFHIMTVAPRLGVLLAVKLSFALMRTSNGNFCRLLWRYTVGIMLSPLLFGLPLIFVWCSAAIYCNEICEENEIYKYNLYY